MNPTHLKVWCAGCLEPFAVPMVVSEIARSSVENEELRIVRQELIATCSECGHRNSRVRYVMTDLPELTEETA